MKIPVSWIKEYIDYNISNQKIAELLTMAGTEVSEIIKFGNEWNSNITIGEIKKIDKHPNADRLSLVEVDNSQNIVEVVCGAPNIQVNQKIALAQPGAKLYNPYEKKISVLKKSKIRGIESNGMICSPLELKYSEDHEGILVLDENEGKDTMPTIEIECEKCGNNKAVWWMLQTRSADEPTTQFFRCTKCEYTWRNYA